MYSHPEHCNTIPGPMRSQDDKTPPHLLLCDLWTSVSLALELTYERRPDKRFPRHHPRSHSWAGTRLATTHVGSDVHQDDQPLHGVVHHTAICSLELCGTIVNCLPLAYKRRGGPLAAGEGGAAHLHFSVFTTILALRLNQTSGTWRLLLLFRHSCSPPLQALWCNVIQRLEHTPAGRTAHGRNQDKIRVIVLLSTGHREIDLIARTS
jgi:hypothetical protein